MPQIGTRKRAAPGASPTVTHQPRTGTDHSSGVPQATPDQYVLWNQSATDINSSYPDPNGNYNTPLYNGSPQPQVATVSASNQLARRTAGQQLVPRASYKSGNETWPVLADDDMQQPTEEGWTNDSDDLVQRALVAKREMQAKRKQIPPFVQKLSSFLDSSQNTELIRWSESGDSFIVLDEDEFARTLIPELFKHNNYASFVRQLNMYGFHKKVGLSDNSMRASERKNKTPSEYYNPFFKRGQPILLWIIQKPKNPHGKGLSKGGTKLKQEDGNLDDDGEETYSRQSPGPPNQGPVENMPSMRNHRQPLMIGNSAAGLPQQDLASVHQELQAVRQNQERITTMLNAVRRDHEHLYGQAAVFQSLHDRHESSINAILTFLATVYNRSLEGQGGQNFANMFAGTIPQDPQGQGNVVDVGEYGDQKMDMSNSQPQRPFRRQPLLLKGPPSIVSNGPIGRASTASPSTTSGTPVQRPQTRLSSTQAHRQPYAMEQSATNSVGRDHFVTTPSDHSAQSPQFKLDDTIDGQIPEADIMSMINSTNASITDFPGAQMDFPQALSHLQNADGKTPLTPNQRNDVLQLMANGSANTTQNGNNNALTSPDPPTMPDMANYNMTKEQIERLGHSIQDQGHTVNRLSTILAPLSPSGSIPGLTDAQGYNGPGGSDMLDLDQYFNSGDYFDDGGIAGDVNLGASADIPDFNFDTSPADEDGTSNGFPDVNGENALGGRIVEALDSSEATSPANTIEDDGADERQSPGKRRRRG